MPELNLYKEYLTNGAGTISGTVLFRAFNNSRRAIMIQNLGASNLYIGGSVVTTANGIRVAPDMNIVLDNGAGADIYATSDGTCSIRFLEELI